MDERSNDLRVTQCQNAYYFYYSLFFMKYSCRNEVTRTFLYQRHVRRNKKIQYFVAKNRESLQ